MGGELTVQTVAVATFAFLPPGPVGPPVSPR